MMDHLQFVQEKMPQILQEREAERQSAQPSK
jgi:hypothetical protein